LKIPAPNEVKLHHDAHREEQIDKLRQRIYEHMRANGERDEHRIALLKGPPDYVVEALIEEASDIGWKVERIPGDPSRGRLHEFGWLILRPR
jgi:hypothetical protein